MHVGVVDVAGEEADDGRVAVEQPKLLGLGHQLVLVVVELARDDQPSAGLSVNARHGVEQNVQPFVGTDQAEKQQRRSVRDF